MPPYLRFLEALGQHVRSATTADLDEQAGEFAPCWPPSCPSSRSGCETCPRTTAFPPTRPAGGRSSRSGRCFAGIASSAAVVLVLDDLHCADPASLDLLCMWPPAAGAAAPGARCLPRGRRRAVSRLCPRARRAEPSSRPRVSRRIFAARGRDGPAGVGALGRRAGRGSAAVLAATSEGNPFFAEELLTSWLESGDLPGGDGRWRLTVARPS